MTIASPSRQETIVLGENSANSRKSDASIGQVATVLVVDNDPAVRHLVTTALEGRGHKVRTATNGREALDKVRLDPPDAILLDLMTPTTDGWSFLATQRMSSAEGRTPVLVMSAVGGRYLARELGARGFLAKPFDLEALETALTSVL